MHVHKYMPEWCGGGGTGERGSMRADNEVCKGKGGGREGEGGGGEGEGRGKGRRGSRMCVMKEDYLGEGGRRGEGRGEGRGSK